MLNLTCCKFHPRELEEKVRITITPDWISTYKGVLVCEMEVRKAVMSSNHPIHEKGKSKHGPNTQDRLLE